MEPALCTVFNLIGTLSFHMCAGRHIHHRLDAHIASPTMRAAVNVKPKRVIHTSTTRRKKSVLDYEQNSSMTGR